MGGGSRIRQGDVVMQKLVEQFVPGYVRWVIRWRWLVVIACLLTTAVAGYGLHNFAFTADYKVYFSKDNAELVAFEKFEDTYTNSENILFVLQPKDKDVFTCDTLEIVRQLTEQAWQIPYAIRVDSITNNYQHTEANGDDLTVVDLVEEPQTLDAAGLARIRAVALNAWQPNICC